MVYTLHYIILYIPFIALFFPFFWLSQETLPLMWLSGSRIAISPTVTAPMADAQSLAVSSVMAISSPTLCVATGTAPPVGAAS